MRPIALAVEPDDVEDLLDLRRWLSENDGLTHNVSRVPEARPEHMGAGQTLALVMASGATVELVRSLREWIRSRRRHLVVRIKNESGEVQVTATNFGEDSAMVSAIVRMIEDEQP
jgi:hypothetical protein